MKSVGLVGEWEHLVPMSRTMPCLVPIKQSLSRLLVSISPQAPPFRGVSTSEETLGKSMDMLQGLFISAGVETILDGSPVG